MGRGCRYIFQRVAMAVDPYLTVCGAPEDPARAPGGGLRGPPFPPGRGGSLCLSSPQAKATPRANWSAPGAPVHVTAQGDPEPAASGRPPALEPPPPGRDPTVRRTGGPPEKISRLPSPAAPRTSPSRPANWSRTRPQRESPSRRRSPPQRVGTGAPLARRGPPSPPRGFVALGGPASPGARPSANWPRSGAKEKRKEDGRRPPSSTARGPGGTPGNRPPSKRPALPGPLMGGCLYAQI